VAVVEMAVVLPLLLTILFGIIEFGWVFMVYTNMTNIARDACRLAVLQGTTESEVTDRVNTMMGRLGVSGYSTNLSRASDEDPTETISIQVPYSSISLLGSYFGFADFNLTSQASMRKEGV
jgi:hypothetical protein